MKKLFLVAVPLVGILGPLPNALTIGDFSSVFYCGLMGSAFVGTTLIFEERCLIDLLIKYFIMGLTVGAIAGFLVGLYITGKTCDFPVYGFAGGILHIYIRFFLLGRPSRKSKNIVMCMI